MNPCTSCKKHKGCRTCKPRRDWNRHQSKEKRKGTEHGKKYGRKKHGTAAVIEIKVK